MLQEEANKSRVSTLAGVHFLLLQTRGGIISAFVETVTSGAGTTETFTPNHDTGMKSTPGAVRSLSLYHPGALCLQADLSLGT